MSEVRNLERRNNKVFMVYDLDSTNLRYPVQKLIIMSAIHPETGSDDFITAVGSIPELSESTDSVWCEMGQFDYDGIEYNVYGTVIHPLSVKPESFKINISHELNGVDFNLKKSSYISNGRLTISGSRCDILDEYIVTSTASKIRELCRAYVDKCNNGILPNNITRTLITTIPDKYKADNNKPNHDSNTKSDKCGVEMRTFKTAIQEQRLSTDDDEIAEWIGDRELVSIDSVVSDNKLIRTVIVKR